MVQKSSSIIRDEMFPRFIGTDDGSIVFLNAEQEHPMKTGSNILFYYNCKDKLEKSVKKKQNEQHVKNVFK